VKLLGDQWDCGCIPDRAKKSIVSCVYQLCPLSLNTSFLSTASASPCYGVTSSRFKIRVEFNKVQVNGFYLPDRQEKCKHFTELYQTVIRLVTESNLLGVLICQR